MLGPISIAIAAILWGVDGILRRSLFSLPPLTIVFYEHLVGLIIIAPFAFRLFRKEKLGRNEWYAIIFVSILSGLIGTLAFTTALQKVKFIPFSVVFLLQKLQPFFAVFAAHLLLRERLTKAYLGWASIAVLAAYFVTFPAGTVTLNTGPQTWLAAILALIAAAAWGSSTAFSRYTLKGHSHTLVTGLRFALTTLFAGLVLIAIQPEGGLVIPSHAQWVRLVAIACSTGLVALWIYYQGLKRTEVKVATILELLFPLTAVFIDVFLYDTVLAPSQYIAGLVLLIAASRVSLTNDPEEQGN